MFLKQITTLHQNDKQPNSEHYKVFKIIYDRHENKKEHYSIEQLQQ